MQQFKIKTKRYFSLVKFRQKLNLLIGSAFMARLSLSLLYPLGHSGQVCRTSKLVDQGQEQ